MKTNVLQLVSAHALANCRRRIKSPAWKPLVVAGLCLAGSLAIQPGASAQTMSNVPPPGTATFRLDRILVKPRHGIPLQVLTNLHALTGCQILRAYPNIQNWQVLRLPRNAAVAAM